MIKSPDRKQLVGQRHLFQPTIPGDNVALWEISLEISNGYSSDSHSQEKRENKCIRVHPLLHLMLNSISIRSRKPCLGGAAAHSKLSLPISFSLVNTIIHRHTCKPTQCEQFFIETASQLTLGCVELMIKVNNDN